MSTAYFILLPLTRSLPKDKLSADRCAAALLLQRHQHCNEEGQLGADSETLQPETGAAAIPLSPRHYQGKVAAKVDYRRQMPALHATAMLKA